MTPEQFRAEHPDFFFLEAEALGPITRYLESCRLLEPDERVLQAGRAGDGNMNCVVRVQTDQRSRILKQSRPWVEKYPHIPAPADRILAEARFFELAAGDADVAAALPHLDHLDRDNRLAVFEDLGESPSLMGLYDREPLGSDEAHALGVWLARVHRIDLGGKTFPNREMRQLNHEHIFAFPFRANNGQDLDALTPGLAQAASEIQGEVALVAAIQQLGEDVYLSDEGACLLHGDYFPGSWMRSKERLCVIDPEFGFVGRPEFDVGVALAHLHLARQAPSVRNGFMEGYRTLPHSIDMDLALQLAGVEILRRLIGVAQLPLEADAPQKRVWMAQAREAVLNPTEARGSVLVHGEA
ncbi:MAG: phosphotransferase [Opitutales bacterium]